MPRPDPQDRWIRAARMSSLLLGDGGRTRTVTEVVEWFGALQGQDFPGVLWSLGVRTEATRDEVGAALASGAILRTWPMRGTLHVLPGADARWMLAHLGGRALRGAQARRQVLGLAPEDADRAGAVLGEALAGGRAMTRPECVATLEAAGIPSAGQRAYHLLWYASQKGITCVGPQRGKEQTFVLLDEFAPQGVDLDRPSALATIAERFVRSHAPVSEHDLARWADLTLADARAGLASAAGVVQRSVAGRELFVTEALLDHDRDSGLADLRRRLPARALPGFDEFVLGYRDRTAQLDSDLEKLVVPGGNGMFSSTLVVDGHVVGTWRRRETARTVEIVATPFGRVPAADRRRLEGSLEQYGAFLGKPSRISWSDDHPVVQPT